MHGSEPCGPLPNCDTSTKHSPEPSESLASIDLQPRLAEVLNVNCKSAQGEESSIVKGAGSQGPWCSIARSKRRPKPSCTSGPWLGSAKICSTRCVRSCTWTRTTRGLGDDELCMVPSWVFITKCYNSSLKECMRYGIFTRETLRVRGVEG